MKLFLLNLFIKVMPARYVKIRMHGESPWGEIIKFRDDYMICRVANKLYHDHSQFEKAMFMGKHFGTVQDIPKLHKYAQDDIVKVNLKTFEVIDFA